MVRIYRGLCATTSVVLALVGSDAAAVSSSTPRALSLELHRLPSDGKHHETYQRRRLKGIENGFESVPLNPGMGTHYAWVYAGTPPQRASVITDTGSSIMAFPCSGCDGCGDHTDQPFSATNSSTLTHVTCDQTSFFRCEGCAQQEKKTCDISQSYMEGSSWRATVVEDIVYLGGDKSFNDNEMRGAYGTHFRFGCQNHETGLFISQVADGIMGLSNNDHHIVAKLYKEKKIPNKLFTLCFAPKGGSMAIGAPDTSRHKGKIEYAPLVRAIGHDFYAVSLKDVRVAGASIEAPDRLFTQGQYIVDSGTTDSYLPSTMRKYIGDAFKKVSGFDYHTSSTSCPGYTDADLDKLPNIEFVLGGEGGQNLTLVVTPDQYLLQESNGKYCSSIFTSESSGGVIGANIMMGHDVIFDQENKRVGFVEADCDYERTPASGIPAVDEKTTEPAPSSWTPTTSQAVAMSAPPPTTEAPKETPAPTTTTPAPVKSETPTPSATLAVEPTSAVPGDKDATDDTPAPSSTSTSNKDASPTPTSTPIPAEALDATTSKTNAPTTTSTDVHTGHDGSPKSENGDDHPMVLTIVGTVLAVAFIVVAAFSVRHHKKSAKDQRWSRVKENEEEGVDDDDEEELIVHTTAGGRAKARSDDFDSDDDDDVDDDGDNVRRGGRLADHSDDDEDDDDEFFDQEAQEHGDHKHDTRTLERL